MSHAVIGITTYAPNEDREFTLPREYVDAVRRAGAIPLLVPPGVVAIAETLSLFDGLILAGGGDVDPAVYGQPRHESTYDTDRERDETELALARAAIESGMPTLGICRGQQLINVALGGTLIQHIPDVVGDEVQHRLPPRESTPHSVLLDEGSTLAGMLGGTEFVTASWHHQAIDTLGRGLVVVARAPDGIIEAVEYPKHPWLHAVQWHPELGAATDPSQQRLFDTFIAACLSMRGTWKVETPD